MANNREVPLQLSVLVMEDFVNRLATKFLMPGRSVQIVFADKSRTQVWRNNSRRHGDTKQHLEQVNGETRILLELLCCYLSCYEPSIAATKRALHGLEESYAM